LSHQKSPATSLHKTKPTKSPKPEITSRNLTHKEITRKMFCIV
jgi:hypothetical protein